MPHFTKDIDEIKGYLLRLAEQVGRRLRRENYQGNIIHFVLGFGDFQFYSKQKRLGEHIDDGYDIFKAAEALFDSERKANEQLQDALYPSQRSRAPALSA